MPIEDMVQVDAVLGKMTIITRANSKIVIDDMTRTMTLQDASGNRIEMGPDGIKFISPKDIVFEAGGKINVQATGSADIVQAALNITQSANVAYTAKGAASAELSAAGQTTVKGALVMIN